MPLILVPSGVAVPSGTLRWAWVDTGGTVHDLTQATSPRLFVSRGAAGLGTPGVELVLEKLPTTAGSVLRYTQTKPLEIELPLVILEDAFGDLLAVVDDLRAWFATGDERAREPGYLRITRPQDATDRQLGCYYAGGLEGSLQPGGPTAAPLVVSLIAPDPFWTALSPSSALYHPSDFSGLPLSVINVGDVDAYPVWTVHGPAANLVISSNSAGKVLRLTANGGVSIAAGETLTIDTRPAGQRTTLPIIDDDGVSHYNTVDAGSALWWLVPGQNLFTIVCPGALVGTTSILLEWLPRYRGVLR